MTIEPVDSFVAVPGGRIFTRRWTSAQADRPPIVLLHDSLGSVDQWREFPAALANATGRSIVAYDRLGFGRSTRRAESPSVAFIREEAEIFFPAISQALDISNFLLFGHSVGGAMALVIAALHRGGCEAVTTEAAQAFVEPRTISGIQAAKKAFRDPEQFARIAKWHGENARWVLEAWTEVWLSLEFRAWSLEPYLGRVRCPVLAIHGDMDEYGSEDFPRRIREGVSGPSELEIVIGCGHVPHRERQNEVLRLTSSFISRYCSHTAAVGPERGA